LYRCARNGRFAHRYSTWDEVIIPSFTFVSTANAFVLRGAKIIFIDSMNDNPNIDADKIESVITSKTKAIVVVHYAGSACDMDKIMDIANQNVSSPKNKTV
jgi:dTDP-4-amino-4,6-dideoxygalactose transaminase